MQQRQAGRAVEAGRYHVKIVTDPHDIRVRIVGINDRIAISAVALVGDLRESEVAGRKGIRSDGGNWSFN
jgi:hypothetical protein